MLVIFFVFKQKTAYEMRISDWSSDVCSSDLNLLLVAVAHQAERAGGDAVGEAPVDEGVLLAVGDPDLRRTRLGDGGAEVLPVGEIGRESCRERVCQYV